MLCFCTEDEVEYKLERHWEINGNLDDEQYGMKNYQVFENGIIKVKSLFDYVFSARLIDNIDFLVDNATAGSGYTPIATPVLGKYIVIKLGIGPNDDEARVIYQFAHELTHILFRAYYGMNKPRANDAEESICTAAALIAVKYFYPEWYEQYENSAINHTYYGYRNGVQLAKELKFDLRELKKRIETFAWDTATV